MLFAIIQSKHQVYHLTFPKALQHQNCNLKLMIMEDTVLTDYSFLDTTPNFHQKRNHI